MIDDETRDLLTIAAALVTTGEGLIKLGSYVMRQTKKKRSRSPSKPTKRRNRRKRR